MTQKTLEEIAEVFAQLRYINGCVNPTGNMISKSIACREGFKAGAQWQRNHVWHKTCDIAKPGKRCLVEYMDGDGNICIRIDWRTEYEWVNASHCDKILRWAYIKDLLPTPFDDILEANKDVLQRLKDK